MNIYPKLIMTREQYFEIIYLTKKCDYEISGMGTLLINKDGNYEVEQLFLLDQECTHTATDLNAEALSKLMYTARACKGQLSFWWHSHVNMSAFFSSQDVLTIQEHARNGYMLGMVVNKREEYQIGLGLSNPCIFLEKEIELVITDNIATSEIERLDKEYEAKVRIKSYAQSHIGYTGYGSHTWDDYDEFEKGIYTNKDGTENIPVPTMWSQAQQKYVPNPAYVLYKQKDLIVDVSSKEWETQVQQEFNKLSKKKLKEVTQLFKDYIGREYTTFHELRQFYIDNYTVIKS